MKKGERGREGVQTRMVNQVLGRVVEGDFVLRRVSIVCRFLRYEPAHNLIFCVLLHQVSVISV